MAEEREHEDALSPDAPGDLSGHFLISEINLTDPNFFRSVVLMITHDKEGAFGLVVNRPSKFTLSELVDGMEDSPAGAIPVYIGGPVQQELLFVLHGEFPGLSANDAGERPVEGVVFEPATQPLLAYLKEEWSGFPESERPAVRLYAGYAGWGPGQVETELKVQSWVVLRATFGITFHPNPERGWADAFVEKGPLYKIILQTGFKPSMN